MDDIHFEELHLMTKIRNARKEGSDYMDVYERLVKYFQNPQDAWKKKNVLYYFVRRPYYVFHFLFKDEKLVTMGINKDLFFKEIAKAPIRHIENILLIPQFTKHIPFMMKAIKNVSQEKYDEVESKLQLRIR